MKNGDDIISKIRECEIIDKNFRCIKSELNGCWNDDGRAKLVILSKEGRPVSEYILSKAIMEKLFDILKDEHDDELLTLKEEIDTFINTLRQS